MSPGPGRGNYAATHETSTPTSQGPVLPRQTGSAVVIGHGQPGGQCHVHSKYVHYLQLTLNFILCMQGTMYGKNLN